MKSTKLIKGVLQFFLSVSNYRYMKFCVLAILILALSGCGSPGQNRQLSLEGARIVVNAGNFSSIQAAIDALPAEGGIINIPPGVFNITEPLKISIGDVCLKGSGTATHIVNNNKAGQPALILASDPSKEVRENEALWRIQISDLRITGNPESGDGILAKNINEIYLEGITVSENGKNGITMDHCYEDPRIVHSVITYNKQTGLNLIGCHDIVVNGNQFEENFDALHCFDGFNLAMSGNNLDDHLNDGVVIENTYGSVVASNMIEECKGYAVKLDRDCYGINIGSNVIAHNGGGVELNDAHGIAVSANTFTIIRTHAVFCSSKCGRITISANNFSDSYIGDGEVKRGTENMEAGGITLDGCRDIGISGNVFSGIQPDKAVNLRQPAKNVLFGNNIIIDSQSDHNKLPDSKTINNLIVSD
ncbi:MAG: right-handed parallel beta-helix repeat-containing protein [Prolixibacteraceae bacterium]|nr:right-handed parallel beta-helix repeat-containing protein [Prolixibacteraceae bacterium]